MRKSLFLVIALAAVTLLVAACQPQASNGTNATDTGGEARFVIDQTVFSNSSESCKVIRFMCKQGYEAYANESGCGCVEYGYNVSYKDPAVISCPSEAEPVCAWFNESTQCFAYPCAVNVNNACLAQTVQNVAYYTKGECPRVGEGVPSEGKVGENELLTYTYQPKQCQSTPWDKWRNSPVVQLEAGLTDEQVITQYYETKSATVSGVQKIDSGKMTCQTCDVCDTSYYFTLQARAGDKAVLADEGWTSNESPVAGTNTRPATRCTDPRPEACTREYLPVCGDNDRTYGNKCEACSDSSVGSYTAGECLK